MTWCELVLEYLPDLDPAHANWVLLDLTCFPFGSEEQVREQLARCAEVGIEAYAEEVYRQLDEAMAEFREQEAASA